MNKNRNWQRDEYVYAQCRSGRTYKDIGQELGGSGGCVRQLYVRACKERRQKYFKTHPGAYKEWLKNPDDEKWDSLPDE